MDKPHRSDTNRTAPADGSSQQASVDPERVAEGPSPYEEAFNRVRAEFLEMPGMRLTAAQVERLSGVANSICKRVLDDLVRAGFLSLGADGTYARSTGLDRGSSRHALNPVIVPR